MEGIPQEVLIVGGLLLAGLAVYIVARFAKQILAVLLVIGGVIIVGVIAWALIQKPDVIPDTEEANDTLDDIADIARFLTPKDEPEQASPSYSPQGGGRVGSGGGFLAGVLTVLVILSLGAGGYFYVRWRLAEGQRMKARGRRSRGARGWGDGAPVIYLVGGPDDEYDDDPVDWEDEWTGDLFQL
jgi:hypothetical protein